MIPPLYHNLLPYKYSEETGYGFAFVRKGTEKTSCTQAAIHFGAMICRLAAPLPHESQEESLKMIHVDLEHMREVACYSSGTMDTAKSMVENMLARPGPQKIRPGEESKLLDLFL